MTWADPGHQERRNGEREARACNEGLGRSPRRSPETEPLAFNSQTEVVKLPSSPYFAVSKAFYGIPVFQGDGEKREGGGGSPRPFLNPPLVTT